MNTQMKILLFIITTFQLSLISPIYSQNTIEFFYLTSPDSQNTVSIKDIDFQDFTVYSIGDINGDGISDLIAAFRLQIYVLYGGADHFENFTIPAWDSNTSFHGYRIYLDLSYEWELMRIGSFGDFNNDGINDIAILSTPGYFQSEETKAIMIYGKDRQDNDLILESSLSKTDGFKIYTVKDYDYRSNWELVTNYSFIRTGDINNDGMDDVMIRRQRRDGNTYTTGALYTLYGDARVSYDINLEDLPDSSKFRIYDENPNEILLIDCIGDINRDGIEDFAAGSSADGGGVYVIYGRIGGLSEMNLTNISSSQGLRIRGDDPYYKPNYYFKHAGDLNGDGITDLIIGAEQNSVFKPVYIIYGKTSGFSDIVLENLTPQDGFKIGESTGKETLGTYLSYVGDIGDINNDGFDDIIIISMGDRISYEKKGYLIFGQKDRRPDIDVSSAENILTLKANVTNEDWFEPLTRGDFNGDGIDDIALKLYSKIYGLYGSNCKGYTDCSSPMPTVCYASKGCACRNKNMMLQDLSCVSSCSPGYYQAPDSTCKICSVNCKECSGNPVCDTCFEGYFLQGSFCVKPCSDGYLLQDSICVSSCSNGYFRQDSSCVSSCSAGYLRQDLLCVRSCSEGYLLQDSLCLRYCSDGYLKVGSSCVPNEIILGSVAGAVATIVIVIIAIVYFRRRRKYSTATNNIISFPAVRFESEIEMRTSTSPSQFGRDSYLERPIDRVRTNNIRHSTYVVKEEEKESSSKEDGIEMSDQQKIEYDVRAKRAEYD